jgi:PTS system mannose-specific IID component
MEEDGEDPAVIERFKSALRGSLGTLGDQLVWTGWRPVCLLATLILLLIGVSWWVAVLAFLVVYNVGHVALMYWGFSVGLTEGRGMAGRLRGAISVSQPRLMVAGAFLGGVAMVLVAGSGIPGAGSETPMWPWAALAGIGIAVGARWGDRARTPAVVLMLVLAAAGLATGWVT